MTSPGGGGAWAARQSLGASASETGPILIINLAKGGHCGTSGGVFPPVADEGVQRQEEMGWGMCPPCKAPLG